MSTQQNAGWDEEFYARYSVRTDLAVEAREVISQQGTMDVAGVSVENEETEVASIARMNIQTDEGARAMGKAKGYYVTITSEALRNRNKDAQEQLAQELAKELVSYFNYLELTTQASALVVGLGNWNATPDALGPKVVGELMVTRHLYEMSPPELRGGLRSVAAIAPGVLGLTGIETGEIIHGIVSHIRPDVVICLDALASRNSNRVCSTIQIADSGIHPGSGIGNKRMSITRETLGCPVLAIGVPTVVHAMTIASDAMELLAQEMGLRPKVGLDAPQTLPARKLDPSRIRLLPDGAVENPVAEHMEQHYDAFGLPIDPQQKKFVIQRLLQPYMGTMIVTPKDIDALIGDVAEVLAGGLNAALHPKLDLTDILKYLG